MAATSVGKLFDVLKFHTMISGITVQFTFIGRYGKNLSTENSIYKWYIQFTETAYLGKVGFYLDNMLPK